MMLNILPLVFLLTVNIPPRDSIMALPINNGHLWYTKYDSTSFCKMRSGVLIKVGDDTQIYSCTKGRVLNVVKIDRFGYQISVLKDSLLYIYSNIDTAYVKKNDNINQGFIIGKKNPNQLEEDDNTILLSVFKKGKELDAQKYIVYNVLCY